MINAAGAPLTSSRSNFYRDLSPSAEAAPAITIGQLSGSSSVSLSASADIGSRGRGVPGLAMDVSLYGSTYGDFQSLSQPPAFFDLPISQISGSASVTFSGSGDLDGRTSLAGATSITFGTSATLDGIGFIEGSPSITISASGDLAGSGNSNIDGSATITFSAQGTFLTARNSGVGVPLDEPWYWWGQGASAAFITPWAEGLTESVGGLAVITISASGSVLAAGPGTLVGAAALTFGATGDITATGALEGAATVSLSAQGDLTNLQIALLAEDVEAASEVSVPTLGQVHVLQAEDVEAQPEVSLPAVDRPPKRATQLTPGKGYMETDELVGARIRRMQRQTVNDIVDIFIAFKRGQ